MQDKTYEIPDFTDMESEYSSLFKFLAKDLIKDFNNAAVSQVSDLSIRD